MKMKEVISNTGLPEKTIRYYESRGLIRPVTERRNGRTYHEFSPQDVEALKHIIVLRKAQFSIEEILIMQAAPERIPEISAALRMRIQKESDTMTRLLGAEDVFSATDWKALSRQIEKTITARRDYTAPFRFGAEDQETPEEKAAAIAAYRKRQNRRPWIPVIIVLSLLCLVLGSCLGYMLHSKATAIPAANGTTEGWLYYVPDTPGQTLYRCKEDGSNAETLYSSALGGLISNPVVTEDKIYFLDGQQLYSINADGSGIHRFNPRYYAGYSRNPGLPYLDGNYLYVMEFSSGSLGGSNSCLVRISLSDGKTEKLDLSDDDMSYRFIAAKDDILYLIRKTSQENEETDEIEYLYELVSYDVGNDTILSHNTLENWNEFSGIYTDGDALLVVRKDSQTENTLLTLDTEVLTFTEYFRIPGAVEGVSGQYCYYRGDFWGNELGGTYEGWYVVNMETGESVGYQDSQNQTFIGFTDNGFLCMDENRVIIAVAYP